MNQNQFKRKFNNFTNAGFETEFSTAKGRGIFLTTVFSIIAFFSLLLFGFESIYNSHYYHGMILLLLTPVLILNYIYLRVTGNYRFSMYAIVLLMAGLELYLFCSGGIDNTGPLWFFVFPPLAFYALGTRRGIVAMLLLTGIILLILIFPDLPFVHARYSFIFIKRFFGVLTAITFMSFVYEYSRKQAKMELTELSCRLDECSRTDELTGLSNRRDMNERLLQEVSRSQRSGRVFSLILCDIDYFKKINDTYGHDCGDQILRAISDLFRKEVRKQDSVARWGGEEFLILLPETEAGQGRNIAERLRSCVAEEAFFCDEKKLGVTISMGVFTPTLSEGSEKEEYDMEHCIRQTDQLLYRAKDNGRNRVEF